ncbi:MAG: universal stress protein [Pirellula sp.]|jgi:nucleotide-binding universal stress UspA family protein|nr:universal stress protein [Pirellula sp.]
MKLNTILCPVDYSSGSEHAIEVASRIATPSQSKVIILTVSDPSKEDGDANSMAELFTKNTRSKFLDQIFEDRGVLVEHLNLRGNPTEVIITIATSKHADVIVMGTHGRTGWTKVFMGSVAQEVMKKAHCPVITVRPKLEP